MPLFLYEQGKRYIGKAVTLHDVVPITGTLLLEQTVTTFVLQRINEL